MTALPNPLGGERRTWSWRQWRVSYVVRGAGAPIVFVHSIHAAAWNAEWRHTVPAMAARGACYAIDLLGFGSSDRPPVHYEARLYLELITDFLREVVQEPALLVGSSLGGTYAVAIAAAHPELVSGVCAIGPAGVSRLTTPGGALGLVVQTLFRSPLPGAALFKALVSRTSIKLFLRDIYADRASLTPETIELFHVSANRPGARFAPAAFVGMRLNHDIRGAIASLTQPLLIAWGEGARQTPISEAAAVLARAPKAEFASLPGGDLPHDERPESFNVVLLRFAESVRATTHV
jgi:pimeloyl-ACP methyl ester carboxylesterase